MSVFSSGILSPKRVVNYSEICTMLSIIENEGKTEGKLEGKVDSAKNAIKAGCSNELIKVITGLSEEQINELRE